MSEVSIRFGVLNEAGQRAATWKLFARTGVGKQDVYLTCRALGGAIKASLHQSGSWHVGFDRGFLRDNLHESDTRQDDLYLDRWPRPACIAPGITLAYRVIVPAAGVNVPVGADELKGKVFWIPSAPLEMAVEIDVIITSPEVQCSDWAARKFMQTELVGSFVLDNGDTVWVVYRAVCLASITFAGQRQLFLPVTALV